jgi:CBS domain containing-hemolysin-like protein
MPGTGTGLEAKFENRTRPRGNLNPFEADQLTSIVDLREIRVRESTRRREDVTKSDEILHINWSSENLSEAVTA